MQILRIMKIYIDLINKKKNMVKQEIKRKKAKFYSSSLKLFSKKVYFCLLLRRKTS